MPSSSNMILPGFTTATHPSGFPLPFPIRVSAGFLVIGLSGNSRIHTLPPRFISRVSATRAASIWRFEIHPGSSVISPYWPNATVLPRVAIPEVRPLNRLRNLTRLGASIASGSRRVGAPRQLLGHLAREDPYLHSDGAVGRLGGGRRVIDVGPQRVQRHTALVVPFRARDLGAAQAPGALDIDPLRPHAHRALHRPLHGAAERNALVELVHYAVADQLRVELGALDLLDVDPDLLARQLRQLVAQLVNLRPALADHDTRPPRVHRHRHLPGLALDVHLGDRRGGAGGWRLRHGSGPGHADLHVAGALLDRRPPPHRGHREPLQGRALVDDRVVDSQPVLIEALVLPVGRLLGVRHGRRQHFPDLHGGVLLGEAQDGVGLRDRPAPNEVHDEAHLPRRLPHAPLHRACFHGLLRDLRRSGFAFLLRRAARVVAAEQARMRELAELVPHHVLRHVDRNELVAVVHGERVPDEVGRNGAAPRPGLEDLLLILVVQGRELLEQRRLHIRALLYRTCHYWVAFPRLRPRTMSLVDAFFLCRVLRPSGLPHGLVGGRPPELLPSPPPSGWSTGFMATPRTRGMRPSQRLFPALPTDSSSCSALPTSPMVARHSPRTMRISVERSRRVTKLPSFATTWALVPAARHSCPPRAILSSTFCTAVPSGISCSGTAFPVRMSAPGPDTTG